MKNRSFRTVALFALTALVTVLLSTVPAFSQLTTGTLRGAVTDSNGGVIQGATVKVKNEATGGESTVVTNSEGLYSVSSLNPGTYTITVEKQGFKRAVTTGVGIKVATITPGDIVLEAGNVAETVTVTANTEEVLQTESAQVSGSIDSRRIVDLPSNGAGGGIDTLALLIPGVVANRVGGTNTNGAGLSVNGNRGRSNNFQIDGSDNNDLSVGGPALFVDFQDAVQEFQVITNNFDARYGRNQGAVVNIVTKGGTNDFHGSLFWHHQNDKHLNSLNNIEKRTGATEPAQNLYNVFGFTVGGPVIFPAFGEGGPRLFNGKDKLFFFAAYQGIRNPFQFTSRSTSAGIINYDLPRLAAAFPNNGAINWLVTASPWAIGPAPGRYGAIRVNTTISQASTISTAFNLSAPTGCPRGIAVGSTPPSGCGTYTTFINPATNQPFLTGGPYDVLNFGTATNPNLFQAANYERTGDASYTEDYWSFRFDVVATSKDNINFRFLNQESSSKNANGSIASGWTGDLPASSKNFGGFWSHTFGSSMTNEFRGNYNKIGVEFGGGCEPGIGCIPRPSQLDVAYGNVTYTTSPTLGVTRTATLPGIFGATTGNNLPQGRIGKVYQFADNLTVIRGKHSMTVGGEYKYLDTLVPFLPSFNGVYAFNTLDRIINNAPNSFTLAVGEPLLAFKEKDKYAFFQDDFKPMSNLTLNLGVRYENTGQPINLLNKLTTARESNASTALFNPSIPLEQRIVPKVPVDNNNFAPRLGFAWSPRPSGGFLRTLLGESATVVRGGYSWAYEPAFYNILVNIMSNTPTAISLTNNALPTSNSPVPLPSNPQGPAVRASAQTGGVLAFGQLNPNFLTWTEIADDFHNPYSAQWSLGIQRQLGRNNIMEVRYVGNHGKDLFQTVDGNPRVDRLLNGFSRNVNLNGVTTAVNFPSFASLLPSGTTAQVCTDVVGTLDNEGICNGKLLKRGEIRTRSNSAESWYNGLQARYNGRLWNDALFFGAAYTFSKTIDTASEIFNFNEIGIVPQNPFCLECEKGLSALDRRHAFSANFVFDVPFFKEQKGALGRVLGGWQINGTYILTSGAPFTPSGGSQGLGATGANYLWSNWGVNERPFYGNTTVDPGLVAISQVDAFFEYSGIVVNDINGFFLVNDLNRGIQTPVSRKDVHFIINGPGAARILGTPFGDVGRNSMHGPKYDIVNLSVFKNIRIWERVKIQLRAEAFNAFNHATPGIGTSFSAVGGYSGFLPPTSLYNAGFAGNKFNDFGDVSYANRVIQLGLRITF
jgi:hypothetical protein